MKNLIIIVCILVNLMSCSKYEENKKYQELRLGKNYGDTKITLINGDGDVAIFKSKGIDSLGNEVEKIITVDKNTGKIDESTPLRMK